jgi:hypothetical protein
MKEELNPAVFDYDDKLVKKICNLVFDDKYIFEECRAVGFICRTPVILGWEYGSDELLFYYSKADDNNEYAKAFGEMEWRLNSHFEIEHCYYKRGDKVLIKLFKKGE